MWYGLCFEIHSLEEIIFHSDQAFITKEGQLKNLEQHCQVNIFLTPKRCYELTHGWDRSGEQLFFLHFSDSDLEVDAAATDAESSVLSPFPVINRTLACSPEGPGLWGETDQGLDWLVAEVCSSGVRGPLPGSV